MTRRSKSRERAFQVEGTGRARVLGQERTWLCVRNRERPAWPRQSGRGGGGIRGVGRPGSEFTSKRAGQGSGREEGRSVKGLQHRQEGTA